ncbi:hypothetical protein HPB51_025638 [Rhipicephalus microplus]|uniref:Uncharacterized protein n=1 Tax=Rhipicephalus microplus TaxID=6941 RepID=A0A9J6F8P4_RHIMP|nr:hypothetical protein HPB51_025638 [Rhipicephalus microplus]
MLLQDNLREKDLLSKQHAYSSHFYVGICILQSSASQVAWKKELSSEDTAREEAVHSPEDLSLLSKTIRNSESKSLAKRAESFENATDDVKSVTVPRKDSEEKKDKTETPRLSLGSVGKEFISKILPVSLGDIPYLNRVTDDAVFEEEDKLVSEIDELLDSDPKEKTEMRQVIECLVAMFTPNSRVHASLLSKRPLF